MKYGHPELLECELLFRYFFFDETHPTCRERCFHVSHRRVFGGCLEAECCPCSQIP